MIFAKKKIERDNIALQMSEFLKGVRAAKSSLCVSPLDGLAGVMKVFGFVLLGHAFWRGNEATGEAKAKHW